jgi:hypothetical protein
MVECLAIAQAAGPRFAKAEARVRPLLNHAEIVGDKVENGSVLFSISVSPANSYYPICSHINTQAAHRDNDPSPRNTIAVSVSQEW